MKKKPESSEPSTTSSYAKDKALKLKVLRATKSHFPNVANYKTYRLLDKLQTYNQKNGDTHRIVCEAYGNAGESIHVWWQGPEHDIRFSRTVQERLQLEKILWSHGFMDYANVKNEPAFSLTVQMTPRGDVETTYRLPKTDEEQFFTYA